MIYGEAQSVDTPMSGNSAARAAVEALFRHLALFLSVLGVVLAGTALITLLTPRTYESEMNILVRNARPDYLLSPERSNGQLTQNEVTEERVGSEIEVLKSRDIADLVVDPNWLQRPLSQRTDAEVKAHEKAVADFSKSLTVESLKKSNVIRVEYVATEPRRATETLERLLVAFLAKQREIERSTGASTFFAAEAAKYKNELDQAEEELAAFQQNNQIVVLGTRETTLESQINLLEDGMRAAQVQMTEAAERVASDKHQLALQPARQSTSQRSIPAMETVQQLTAMLTTYQNERTSLLTRYQPTDRLVVEKTKQITDTAAALANARTTNGEESTTDVNPVYQQLKTQLSTSTADLAALQGRLADLTAQRNTLKRELSDVEGSAVDYSTLQSRVTELESNFQLYTQKKNEAAIADAMNQQQLVNVAVAERPTFSDRKYRPQTSVNLAMGLFTGLFLAGCAVFFAELGRETIAAPWELEAVSKAPVLATVPHVPDHSGFGLGAGPRGSTKTPARQSGGGGGWPEPSDGSRIPVGRVRSGSPQSGIQRLAHLASKQQGTDPAERMEERQGVSRQETVVPSLEVPVEPNMKLAETPVPIAALPAELRTPIASSPRDATVIRRAAVLSYEQLAGARANMAQVRPIEVHFARPEPPVPAAEPIAREPLAYPWAPMRPAGAARPMIVSGVDPEPIQAQPAQAPAVPYESQDASHLVPVEPIEPSAEVKHRGLARLPQEVLDRSRMSPSQRAALYRPTTKRDRNGRATYVTYTVDPLERS